MNPPTIIGVDPGLTGAIAAIHADTGALLWVEDMPITVVAKGKNDVSPALLADTLRIGMLDCKYAVVEQVHSMPGQGVATSFKFGKGYGCVLGVIAALGIPTMHVTPQVWKKVMRVTADKGLSRTRAIELWPEHSHLFARVKDDGRAEAAMIARWAWETRRT